MAGLDSLYQEIVLDHAKRRVGQGPVVVDDASDGAGSATSFQRNPVCGDEITLRAVADDDGALADVTWDGAGCSISQASASMLTELARGEKVTEVAALTEEFREAMRSKGRQALDEERFGDAAALSGVSRFTARVKCAMLAWVALEDAVRRARPSSG